MLLTDVWHIPIWASLLAITTMIGVSVITSLRSPPEAIPLPPGFESSDEGA